MRRMTKLPADRSVAETDTIFALSSGSPPAAIAVVRISGPRAGDTLAALTGKRLTPRRAALTSVRDPQDNKLLDRALALWFPGPATATGEDLAELHLHGGRAVVRAVEAVLARQAGLRQAQAGEFTRRSFANGRIDLAEAEGLADLLSAESEYQRQSALQMASGRLSAHIADWQEELLRISAKVEAELDFSDEDDVAEQALTAIRQQSRELARGIATILSRPRAERMRDGIRVVLAGSPNAGKSSLFNALLEREAAIVTDLPGTTRDILEASVSVEGLPLLLVDTAGLRYDGGDPVERIGIERATAAAAGADILLWLGEAGQGPQHPQLVEIAPKCDSETFQGKPGEAIRISSITGEGIDALMQRVTDLARTLLPRPDNVTVNARQAAHLEEASAALELIESEEDYLIVAEHLRRARNAMDAITGRADTEAMLDTLFGRFCIGK